MKTYRHVAPYDNITLDTYLREQLGNNISRILGAYNVVSVKKMQGKHQVSIAIIVAYRYPNLQNDFNLFCSKVGITPSLLQIVNLNQNTKNTTNVDPTLLEGWFIEACMDVQWCYAMNQNAKIYVVQAASDSQNDLLNAVKYTNNNIKPDIVSMSWGCTEFANEEIYESLFSCQTTCYLAASGDTASVVSFPSCESNVLSCGGTTMTYSLNGGRQETCWSDSGCGISNYVPKPAFQKGVNVSGKRSTPDVCTLADPATGVPLFYKGKLYNSLVGGTSLACPLLAGMLSNFIQSTINRGMVFTTVTSGTKNSNLQTYLYNLLNNPNKKGSINDITSGKDGNYSASSGFDVATGLGSLNIIYLINSLNN